MNGSFFAGRLIVLRKDAGLSQKDLAEKAGLTIRQVSRMETGVQKPSWETVIAICEAIGVSCEEFRKEPEDGAGAKRGRPAKATDEPADTKTPPKPRGRTANVAPESTAQKKTRRGKRKGYRDMPGT